MSDSLFNKVAGLQLYLKKKTSQLFPLGFAKFLSTQGDYF